MFAEITTTVEEGRRHEVAALTASPTSIKHVLGFAALALQKAIGEGYRHQHQRAEYEALLQDVTESLEQLDLLTTEPIPLPEDEVVALPTDPQPKSDNQEAAPHSSWLPGPDEPMDAFAD